MQSWPCIGRGTLATEGRLNMYEAVEVLSYENRQIVKRLGEFDSAKKALAHAKRLVGNQKGGCLLPVSKLITV